jgi:CheY-like chemotaxis protein
MSRRTERARFFSIALTALPPWLAPIAPAGAVPAVTSAPSALWLAPIALVSGLAVSLGWAYAMRREVKRGTSATVRLTLGACDVKEVAGADQWQAPLVLIADGDRVQQIVLTTTLRQLGIDSDVADDANQALELWRERRHDLVLVDCRMPGTDGLALARQLIEEGGSAVRVIGVSADRRLMTRAMAAGISAMVPEPVCEAQLQEAIAAAMGGRSHEAVGNGRR